MSTPEIAPAPTSAIVARPPSGGEGPASYLKLDASGQPSWTFDPAGATPFASMREAARAAFRLPASLRAYGLPRRAELTLKAAY